MQSTPFTFNPASLSVLRSVIPAWRQRAVVACKLTRGVWLLLVALLLFASFVQAQDARPEFEVASIHPADLKGQRPGVSFTGGRFSANGISARLLIEMAYQLQPFRLSGAPEWVDSDLYTIQASWPKEANGEKVREMLQRLLEDRFSLRMRKDSKEADIYALLVRDKSKLQPTKTPGRSMTRSAASRENGNVRTEFIAVTIDRFADALSRELNRLVVDETGLIGEYDLVLQTEREVDEKNMFVTPLAPSVGQIGLKLESRKGTVEFYRIESIQHPSEN
jgi:uncharacterized protein (TIGR03435 family)